MKSLTVSQQQSVDSAARLLNVDSLKLKALIDFESGFNPAIINKNSGAIGLIQFMPDTLKSMGFTSGKDFVSKNPTIESQMKYVYLYLKKYMPIDSDKKLFMSVFYPKASTWPDIKMFPFNVQKQNPGIVRVSDYMRKVYIRIGIHYLPAFFLCLVLA